MDTLYSVDILTLSAALKDERLDKPCGQSRQISKLCGSELELDLAMIDGCVTDCAVRVRACALGQAAAAIVQQDIIGARADEIADAEARFTKLLKCDGKALDGRFSRLNMLEGVKDYPARHTSTLLAIKAAAAAAEQCESA